MQQRDILLSLIEDYIEQRLDIELFTKYYYDIYNFLIDYETLTDYDYTNFQKISREVDFFNVDQKAEYPYMNDEKEFYNSVNALYNNLVA